MDGWEALPWVRKGPQTQNYQFYYKMSFVRFEGEGGSPRCIIGKSQNFTKPAVVLVSPNINSYKFVNIRTNIFDNSGQISRYICSVNEHIPMGGSLGLQLFVLMWTNACLGAALVPPLILNWCFGQAKLIFGKVKV